LTVSELQELVDSLACRIGRSVVIHDQRFRLAAFSSQGPDVDNVRRASILERRAPDEAARWMLRRGVQRAFEPMRIKEVPELGMRARVCVPIRFDGVLLGYMWLIEDRTKLTDEDLAACVEAAGDAAPLMYRERILDDHARERERQCVADLLDASVEIRLACAQDALEAGLLLASSAYGVIAVESRRPLDGRSDEQAATRLAALERTRRTLRPHGCVVGNCGSRGVVIAAVRGGDDGRAELSRIARRLRSDLGAAGTQSDDWRLGQGPVVRELASATVSYDAALDAIRIAAAVPELGDLAVWDQLGAWKLLSLVPAGAHVPYAIHPGLTQVAALRDGDVLLHTLEAYLDNGGDAQETASELYIHRTSLYARLRRLEREAGVDLGNGEDRLTLHISLRLMRLTGAGSSRPADVNRNGRSARVS
jgi:sugar diacid utilization regulator